MKDVDILTEKFLRQYFRMNAILEDLMTDAQRQCAFKKLGEVYTVDKKEADELYEVCENLRDVSTAQQCAQTQRIVQYLTENNLPMPLQQKELELLLVKSAAISDCVGAGIVAESSQLELRSDRLNNLMVQAGQGVVLAMNMVFFLMSEEIVLKHNKQKEEALLSRLNEWIDIDGYIFALYFDRKNKETYLSRLYTLVKNRYIGDEDVYTALKRHYKGTEDTIDNDIESLLKLEEQKTVRCEMFSTEFTKVGKLGFGG